MQETKRWLERYRELGRIVDNKEAELQVWRSKAERMTVRADNSPGGGGDRKNIERCVAAMQEIEQELSTAILEAIAVRKEIEDAVNALDNPVHRELLRLRYIETKEKKNALKRVARVMNYSYDWTRHLHRMALVDMKEYLAKK